MKFKLLAFVFALTSCTTVSTAYAGGPGNVGGGHKPAATRGSTGAELGGMASGHGKNDSSRIRSGKNPELRQSGSPKNDSANPKPHKPDRREIEQGNGEHRPGGPQNLGPSGHGPNAAPKHGPASKDSKKNGVGNQAGGIQASGKSTGPKAGPNGGSGSKRG